MRSFPCPSLSESSLVGNPFVVEFDFLGKDSIRYNNASPVEKRVYKNVALFMENKKVNLIYFCLSRICTRSRPKYKVRNSDLGR